MNEYVKAMMDFTTRSVRTIHTPSLQAKSMFYYIQEVGHFYALPQYYTERKEVHSYLVVYTLSGIGCLSYRDVQYTLLLSPSVKNGKAPPELDCSGRAIIQLGHNGSENLDKTH